MIQFSESRFLWPRNNRRKIHVLWLVVNVERKIKASCSNDSARCPGPTCSHAFRVEKVDIECKKIVSFCPWPVHKQLPCLSSFRLSNELYLKSICNVRWRRGASIDCGHEIVTTFICKSLDVLPRDQAGKVVMEIINMVGHEWTGGSNAICADDLNRLSTTDFCIWIRMMRACSRIGWCCWISLEGRIICEMAIGTGCQHGFLSLKIELWQDSFDGGRDLIHYGFLPRIACPTKVHKSVSKIDGNPRIIFAMLWLIPIMTVHTTAMNMAICAIVLSVDRRVKKMF